MTTTHAPSPQTPKPPKRRPPESETYDKLKGHDVAFSFAASPTVFHRGKLVWVDSYSVGISNVLFNEVETVQMTMSYGEPGIFLKGSLAAVLPLEQQPLKP